MLKGPTVAAQGQLLGAEGSALAWLAGVGVHICPMGSTPGNTFLIPTMRAPREQQLLWSRRCLYQRLEHDQGMGDQGKRSTSCISSEDCLEGRTLGLAGVPLLGESLSHEAVKLPCSLPLPV